MHYALQKYGVIPHPACSKIMFSQNRLPPILSNSLSNSVVVKATRKRLLSLQKLCFGKFRVERSGGVLTNSNSSVTMVEYKGGKTSALGITAIVCCKTWSCFYTGESSSALALRWVKLNKQT